ncbi:MAG TPA: zinc-dependent alcohol dehydrogenase family protein [Streptosporangiaceae bacterium]|jgi:NADPH:quinone reductase-like Zn-dependent oxidoreductase|nr:zinc-dependent alcohol dehydrogenase family protein [Streptosporangiaceae bacterium]
MKSLQLTGFGNPAEVVTLSELALADPGPGEVLVQLEAAPINPSDLMLIAGVYGVRPDLPAALGAEGVGRIVAIGDGVDASRVGERVIVLPRLTHATWREQTILDQDNAVPVDRDADRLQLAMLGINPATAHVMLHGYTELEPGAWVAQTGASSATAGYVLALAKHAGLRTLSVVRRADAVKPLLEAGSDVVLVEGDDLHRQAADALGHDRLELILDAVGGEPVAQLAKLMKVGGHVVSYTSRELQPVKIPVGDLIFRGINVHGFWLKNWLDATQPAEIFQTYRQLAALVANGALSAPVEATYALEDHRAALEHATRNGRHGKVLFTLE